MSKIVALALLILDMALSPIVFLAYYVVGMVYLLCNCLRNGKEFEVKFKGFNKHFIDNIIYNLENGVKEHKKRILGVEDSKES